MPLSNTLDYVAELTQSGMAQPQADAVVRVMAAITDNHITREYFETRISALEARMEAKIEKSIGDAKTAIVMWTSGALIAQAGVIVALIKLL